MHEPTGDFKAASPTAPRSRNIMWGLVAGTVLSALCLPLALMWAGFSVMASDAGTSPAIETFIYLSFGIPLCMLLGPILAWIAWAMRRNRLAIALLFLPILPFVASIVVMASAPN